MEGSKTVFPLLIITPMGPRTNGGQIRQSKPWGAAVHLDVSADPSFLNTRGPKVNYTVLLGKQDWNIFVEGQRGSNTFSCLFCFVL